MKSNEGKPAETDIQDKYESTVLDFLDNEIASVQATQQKKHQSDELDALVTDLLKQVITEADQPVADDKPLFDDDELFSVLTSAQKQNPITEPAVIDRNPIDETDVPPASGAESPEPVEATDAQVFTQEWADETAPAAAATVVFTSSTAPKKKLTAVAAVAAGVIVVIGTAAYYFTNSPDKKPVATESRIAAAEPVLQTVPSPLEVVEAEPPRVAEPVQPARDPKPAVPAANQAVAPAPSRASANHPPSPQEQSRAAAAPKTEPIPAPAEKAPSEEREVLAQRMPVSPIPMQIAATIEKPAVPPPVEQRAPASNASPERKPNPAPAASNQSETAAPESQPVRTSAINHLVAAVPIVQATPVFPEIALRARTSGSVILELQIDDQGKVVKATPVSGPAVFYNAAVTAAMRWRYKPASIGGINVSSQSRVTMAFNLK